MLQWLKGKSKYQNDQTWCKSSYRVFPPKAIHSSGILVSIRVHQRYDVPLKLFQYVIRPEIVLRMNSSLILRTRCPGALRDLCTSWPHWYCALWVFSLNFRVCDICKNYIPTHLCNCSIYTHAKKQWHSSYYDAFPTFYSVLTLIFACSPETLLFRFRRTPNTHFQR